MKINAEEILKFGNIELLAKQAVEGFITGMHKSPYHGFSVEFAEHRLYNTGEGTRHIDWKVYAKTDRLFTKRYEEETNLRCRILIDVSLSMFYPEKDHGKLVFSVAAAAALAYMLQKQRDAVGLTYFSDEIEYQSQIKSTGLHLTQLFQSLEQLLQRKPLQRKTAIAKVLHDIAESIHRRSLVVIFSDMFDNAEEADSLFAALQHLKHNKHEVILFHVVDKATEEDFIFEERPYEFIDIESGEKLKLRPSQVRETYSEAMNAYLHELKIKCHQYKVSFAEIDIKEDIGQVLFSYLVKRGKMS